MTTERETPLSLAYKFTLEYPLIIKHLLEVTEKTADDEYPGAVCIRVTLEGPWYFEYIVPGNESPAAVDTDAATYNDQLVMNTEVYFELCDEEYRAYRSAQSSGLN